MAIANKIPSWTLPAYRKMKSSIKSIYYKCIRYPMIEVRYWRIERKIRDKIRRGELVNVGFIGYPSAPSVDVFSNLYTVFKEDKRFQCTVVAMPYTHNDKKSMVNKYQNVIDYLGKRGISYVHGYDIEKGTYYDYSGEFDIAFFEIEYDWVRPEFKVQNFSNALTYFIPYGPYVADNIAFHYSHKMMSEVHCIFTAAANEREMLCKYSMIKGRNVCKQFLGYPKNDIFFKSVKANDVWTKANPKQKRIIWAPHHTWANYSNFHTYAEFFVKYTKEHPEVFVAFKPHPALKDSLRDIDGWSSDRITKYYALWQNGNNTALFEGEWFDLFLTSDAMIMDSISFMVEYSLTNKPSCVLIRENEDGEREMRFSDCGEVLYSYLYHAKNMKEVEEFIDNVRNGIDSMADSRIHYIENNYRPPFGKSGSENIYEYIKNEIGIL